MCLSQREVSIFDEGEYAVQTLKTTFGYLCNNNYFHDIKFI